MPLFIEKTGVPGTWTREWELFSDFLWRMMFFGDFQVFVHFDTENVDQCFFLYFNQKSFLEDVDLEPQLNNQRTYCVRGRLIDC